MLRSVDVLLINPKSWTGRPPSYLPYGLLFIAAYLRENGYDVSIYDRNVDGRGLHEVMEMTTPKVVGLSVLTGPVIIDAVEISKKVKAMYSGVTVVWGGLHPTIFPTHVIKKDYIDFIITGEGEAPLKELLDVIQRDSGKLEDIANLVYRDNEVRIIRNPERDFIDLDSLPLPAWDLVDIPKYLQNKFYANRVLTINTSRGCPYRCAYCYNQAVNHRRWRAVKAGRIIDYIDHLQKEHDVRGFQIYDDSFDVSAKRVREFCGLLLEGKRNILWQHFSRVNFADRDLLRFEKQAGLRFIEYGLESGSPRMLEFMEKDQTTGMVTNAYGICSELNIASGALFMVGLPTETPEDVQETIRLVSSIKAHSTINTIYKPYPATRFFDYCIENDLFSLPEDIEDHGHIYGLDDTMINVSQTPSDVLSRVYDNFAFNNVKNELSLCLKHGNLGLIAYHLKNRFRWSEFAQLGRGLRSYRRIRQR